MAAQRALCSHGWRGADNWLETDGLRARRTEISPVASSEIDEINEHRAQSGS